MAVHGRLTADRADGLREMLGTAVSHIVAVYRCDDDVIEARAFLTASATRPGSNTSSASGGLPVAMLQKVQARVQTSPMIIMVA